MPISRLAGASMLDNDYAILNKLNMKYLLRSIFLLLLLVTLTKNSILQAQDWQLVWADEFDGNSLDESKWSYQFGTGSSEGLSNWGNNELQYYTDREENIFVQDGNLHIVAREESYQGKNYTSARLRSIYQGDWKYGRFEIRAKLPKGQGLWPAVWMMPTDDSYGGWAGSGEIDIMELVGHEPDVVHGTLHYGGSWPDNVESGASFRLDEGAFADNFHTFVLEWREGKMRWSVDGQLYQTQSQWFTQGHDFPAPFDKRFHMLLNVAVGGNWPGSPDGTTEFPQQMIIDYVRVYQTPDMQEDNEDGTAGVQLPVDFEDTDFSWDDVIVNFDGGTLSVVENPDLSDYNPSDYVGRMVKDGGEFWGGAWMPVQEGFVFDEVNHEISMKVWSPRKNVPVLMKIEQKNGPNDFETSVNTTTSGKWETLTWDLSGAGIEKEWDILTIIFELISGQVGDGGSDFTWYFDDLEVLATETSTSTEENSGFQPHSFSLDQNYPNPFNPTTQIQFELPEQSEVLLQVYDVTGRRVARVADGRFLSGRHTVEFNASNLPSGLYIYRLRAGSFVETQKMILLK